MEFAANAPVKPILKKTPSGKGWGSDAFASMDAIAKVKPAVKPADVKPADVKKTPANAITHPDEKIITNKMKDQLAGKHVVLENAIITRLVDSYRGTMFNKNTMTSISDRLFVHFYNQQVVNVKSDYKKILEGKYVFFLKRGYNKSK